MEKLEQERVLGAYQHALDLPEEERQEYLDREFDGDDELREVVDALLKSKLGSKWKPKKRGRDGGDPDPLTESQNNDTVSYAEFYGDSLPEHYRFIQKLGKGGMGEVVLAEDVRLNRKVAIKFLSKDLTADPERLKRFRYEAQAASALNHPNIVTVHDIGEGNGYNYIVCEYVSGETLSHRIARGRLPVREAVDIAIEICSALAAAHRSGIIHRDIKPDNVVLRPDGGIKVLDFGLAKSISGPNEIKIDEEANTFEKVSTIPGMVMGTPQYMSPEQARGRDVDDRSDLFSMGVLLYEMVTGKPPFRGKSPVDVILALTGKEPPKLEEELLNPPEGLVRILKRALMKDRRDRYDSAESMLADLRTLRGELDTAADGMAPTGIMDPKTTARNTVGSLFKRRLVWEVPLILVLLILVAFGVYYFFGLPDYSNPGGGSLRSVNITKWNAGPGELISAASFSPDGTRIAFGSARQNTTKIWFQPTGGGEPVEVTKEDVYSQYPVWSPDGEEIAFFSNRTGEPGIWRIPYTGGRPARLIGRVDPAASLKYWSPSGKIYFRSAADLFWVPVKGGNATAVTSFAKQKIDPRVLEISRDESQIAYSVLEGDVWKLKVVPANGGDPVEIASSPEPIDQAAWGPNGSLLYYSGRVNGVYQVFRTAVGGGDPVQISNGLQDSQVEDVSADGKRILYSALEESSDLWVVDRNSGDEEIVADEVGAEYWADISPDGKDMVYQSVTKAGMPYEGAIESRALAGSADPQLLADKGFSPIYSHDGKSVAYFVSTNGKPEIWKVGVKGGDSIKLVDGEIRTPDFMMMPYLRVGSDQISWSPSDDAIAFSKRVNGRSDIWTVPVNGGAEQRLSDNRNEFDIYCCPEWNGAGNEIVFWSSARPDSFTDRGRNAIWVLETASKQQRMVFDTNDRLLVLGLEPSGKSAIFLTAASDTGMPAIPARSMVKSVDLTSGKVTDVGELANAFFFNVTLSPDGRSLAYVTQDQNESAIKLRNLNSGVEKILLTEKDPKVLISSLEWSPDGKKIVFGRQSRSNLLSMFVD